MQDELRGQDEQWRSASHSVQDDLQNRSVMWFEQPKRGKQRTALKYGLQDAHAKRGLTGPQRPMSANSNQNGLSHAHMVHRLQWDHQTTF